MTLIKKLFSIFAAICIVAASCAVSSYAADTTEMTYLYIDKGSIVIGDGTVSGYGAYGEKINSYDSDGYCITSTKKNLTVNNTVEINGGKNTVVLKNVSAAANEQFMCVFYVCGGSELQLILDGDNKLVGGASRAGLEISENSSVTISGDGSLYAESKGEAGIGGGNGASNGTLVINSGSITAKNSYNSAGIGGGSSGNGGNIIINGGNVAAYGGDTAAGIGGGCAGSGGNIVINGGTVTAIGGENGAGIGGGWYGEMGTVKMNGGSVKAIGGTGAPSVGDGAGLSGSFAENNSGERVYMAVIDASSLENINEIYTNGAANKISGSHPDDGKFYLYLPKNEYIIALKPQRNNVMFYKLEYSSAFDCQEIEPMKSTDSAYIRTDNVIGGITCGLTSLNKYFTLSDGFSLRYGSSVIGTGTEIELIYSEKCVYTFKALLYGDVNGDGFYDGEDSFIVLLMLWDKLDKSNTDYLYFEAADANRNGGVDENDMQLLQQAGLLLEKVEQSSSSQVSQDSYEEYLSLIDQSNRAEENINDGILSVIKTLLLNILKRITEFLDLGQFYVGL